MTTKLRGGVVAMFVAMGLPWSCSAQLGWGVMAGLQITNIGSNLPSTSQLRFQGGIFGEVDAILVGARAKTMLSTKDAEVQLDLEDPLNETVTVKSNIGLLYLDLPLMFNLHLIQPWNFTLVPYSQSSSTIKLSPGL